MNLWESDRALAPATRARYRVMNHLPKCTLFSELALNVAPLQNLARSMGGLEVAIAGPNLFRPVELGLAVVELAAIFFATRRGRDLAPANPA